MTLVYQVLNDVAYPALYAFMWCLVIAVVPVVLTGVFAAIWVPICGVIERRGLAAIERKYR